MLKKKNPKIRKSWDNYFLELAKLVSTRATCDRLRVGAVVVKDRRILSTGYNGSIAGAEHCDDVGHLMIHDHCVRTVHAEINALSQAAKNGTKVGGSTIYITHAPCINCFKAIVSSGITKIIFTDLYRLTYNDVKIYEQIVGFDGKDCNWNIGEHHTIWSKA